MRLAYRDYAKPIVDISDILPGLLSPVDLPPMTVRGLSPFLITQEL